MDKRLQSVFISRLSVSNKAGAWHANIRISNPPTVPRPHQQRNKKTKTTKYRTLRTLARTRIKHWKQRQLRKLVNRRKSCNREGSPKWKLRSNNLECNFWHDKIPCTARAPQPRNPQRRHIPLLARPKNKQSPRWRTHQSQRNNLNIPSAEKLIQLDLSESRNAKTQLKRDKSNAAIVACHFR